MKNIFYILFFSPVFLYTQTIDKIEAIIGDEIILTSDIESQYLQYISQGGINSVDGTCEIFEDLLFQKILVNQAKFDSINISNDEVEKEIQNRITYFERQLGSSQKVELYFNKSMNEIKDELFIVIQDQFYAQRMQAKVTSKVKVTPSEVQDIFNKINTTEIPVIPTQMEISQVVIKPKISKEQEQEIKDKLNKLKDRINKGEDFKVLAALYSDDQGSATNGGELGFVSRGDLVPSFERAAFRLKEGEISEIIKSQYGFHIVQLISRRGEQINVRHILVKAKPNASSIKIAEDKATDIFYEINASKISFEDAVLKYSEDDSRNNAGLLLNPKTLSSMYSLEDMSADLAFSLKNLKQGDVSNVLKFKMEDGNYAYRILKINKKIDTHKANLIDDYTIIKDYAINEKKQELLLNWTQKIIDNTYIKINGTYKDCSFKKDWIN
ncbi:MAG: peptidylprolyl isomerase [Flavobacteriales bacterium]|nr:peptidylprolyl isomerase [Flavobacteriales bacterium]